MTKLTNKNDKFNSLNACKEILYRMVVSSGGVIKSNELLRLWCETTIDKLDYETCIYRYKRVLYSLFDDGSIYEDGGFIYCK